MLVGVLHTLGLANDPPNEAWAQAIEAAKSATIEAGPISLSFYEVYESVWIQVGALLVMYGAANLIVAMKVSAADAQNLIRALARFNAVAFLALTIFFGYYQIPPPFISFAILTILFGFASFGRGNDPAKTEQGAAS